MNTFKWLFTRVVPLMMLQSFLSLKDLLAEFTLKLCLRMNQFMSAQLGLICKFHVTYLTFVSSFFVSFFLVTVQIRYRIECHWTQFTLQD